MHARAGPAPPLGLRLACRLHPLLHLGRELDDAGVAVAQARQQALGPAHERIVVGELLGLGAQLLGGLGPVDALGPEQLLGLLGQLLQQELAVLGVGLVLREDTRRAERQHERREPSLPPGHARLPGTSAR
jgi:hypothetical protein